MTTPSRGEFSTERRFDESSRMNGLLKDCRHAVRLYLCTPSASLIAVFVLALGMAFVIACLSLYVDLALRPHPGFEQSSRIVTIGQNAGDFLVSLNVESVERLGNEMTSIEAIAGWTTADTLIRQDREEAEAVLVSEAFFEGLRPRLLLGRGLLAEDDAPDAEPVVVLSHRFWRQGFGADPGVLDGFVEIARDPDVQFRGANPLVPAAAPEQDSARFRIVGVMAPTLPGLPLQGPPSQGVASSVPKIWLPLKRAWPLFRGEPAALNRSMFSAVYARLAPGVSVEAVASELTTRYDSSNPLSARVAGSRLDAIGGMVTNITVRREASRQLRLFLAGSVLLALVAAANVSLFLLARAPARRRELGIRLAMGAQLRRLARQLVTEAGLLVGAAAIVGLIGSVWLGLYLRSLSIFRDAEWRNVTLLDWRVLALSGVVVLVLTVFVALSPVLGIRRLDIASASRATTARASWPQRLVGMCQLALAGTLSSAALALGWHFGILMYGDPGFEIANRFWVTSATQTFDFTLSQEFRAIESARRREAVEGIPGVLRVAYGEPVPGGQVNLPARVPNPLDPANTIEVHIGEIGQPFIDLLGLNLLYGRAPENQEPLVVVVNQALARMVWGRDDVVGEFIGGDARIGNLATGEGSEIIGVLEDIPFGHPAEPVRPFAFRGYPVLISAVIETDLTAAELEQALDGLDPTQLDYLVRDVRSLQSLRNEMLAADRARALLTITTSALVVFLAAFGFYGMQRYLVAAGRREYAIRSALGAGPSSLTRLVYSRGLMLGLPGLILSALLAVISVSWLRDDYLTAGVSTFGVAVVTVLGLTGLLLAANLGPARQARRTQAAAQLRQE